MLYMLKMEFFIVVFVLLTFLGALISIVGYSIYHGITPMPTSRKAKNFLFSCLPGDLPLGTIFELGSGWGTLAFPLAVHYPSHIICAYEHSPVPYLFSKLLAWMQRPSLLSFRRCDFFSVSLHDSTLIVCYLCPEAMKKLKAKFEKELKPGTWVVSNTFAIPDWKPETICEVNDLYHTKIYVYKVPS